MIYHFKFALCANACHKLSVAVYSFTGVDNTTDIFLSVPEFSSISCLYIFISVKYGFPNPCLYSWRVQVCCQDLHLIA